jgi:hypothetical protein
MHPALVLVLAVAWHVAAGSPLPGPSSLAGIESEYQFRPERAAGFVDIHYAVKILNMQKKRKNRR